MLPSRAPARVLRGLLPVIATATLVALSGCGNQIGDACQSSIDCSLSGDGRSCDISQPGGYCTIEACGTSGTQCPDEAVCVRFFPTAFLTRPCDPEREDIRLDNASAMTRDDCRPEELCLSNGLCAPRATERRFCALKCGGDGDCRSEYECRLLGTGGSEALDPGRLGRDRFCAPRPRS